MKALRILVLIGSFVLVIPFVFMIIQAVAEGYDRCVLQRLIDGD